MKKILFIVVGSIAVAITGCAKQYMLNDPELYNQYMTRNYGHSKAACYNAVKAMLADEKIPIAKDEPEKGKLVTEKFKAMSVVTGNIQTYNGQGTVSAQKLNLSFKYWFHVTGDETSCTVKMTKLRMWMNDGEAEWVRPDDAGKMTWDPMFRSIGEQLEDDNE